MLFFSSKEKTSPYNLEALSQFYLQIDQIQKTSQDPFDILKPILSFFKSHTGSLFLAKSNGERFVIKSWIGSKPLQSAIDADHAFVKFLKRVPQAVLKDDLNKKEFLEIRSSGYHYFTQLSCSVVVPLAINSEWFGLMNLGRFELDILQTNETKKACELLGAWYAQFLSQALLLEENRNYKNQFKELTRIKDQFFTNITHELRTPLNGILGLTDLILEGADGEVSADQRKHLEMIKSAGDSLLDLINNVLTHMKTEVKGEGLKVSRISLIKIVDEISSLFEGVLTKQKNSFQSLIPKEAILYGDEDQIRTVLMNLIGNATKFTNDGHVEVIAQKSGDLVKICVKDTGIGIAEEDQIKIFDEFVQVDGSASRAYGGTGLGLSLAKKIIEKHGGRLWVDSVLGKGSEFYFTLPAIPQGIEGLEKNI